MITEPGMQALRCGATLAAALPNVHLRIRDGERLLAEVTRAPMGTHEAPQIPVCAFRAAVARAHTERSSGQILRFLTLPDGKDPSIDVGVRDGVAIRGGIVRSTMGPRWVHVAALAGPLDANLAAIGADLRWLSSQHDPELDVTLLHAATPTGDVARSAVVVEALTDALARSAIAELEALLHAAANDAGGPTR